MAIAGRVTGAVKRVPGIVWVCATIILIMEIVAVAINVDVGRPVDQLLTFIASINAILVTAIGVLSKADGTSTDVAEVLTGVEALRNGEMDDKLKNALGDVLPELVGSILDARGIPVRTPVVPSPHDSPTPPTLPPTGG